MKKVILAFIPFLMLCACGGNQKTDGGKDSAEINETSVNDSTTQDSIPAVNEQSINNENKAEEVKDKSAEYDELINQYVAAVNKYAKLRQGDNWDAINKVSNKYRRLEKQISKIKGNLNKEQLSKFKKAKAKAINWEDYH